MGVGLSWLLQFLGCILRSEEHLRPFVFPFGVLHRDRIYGLPFLTIRDYQEDSSQL